MAEWVLAGNLKGPQGDPGQDGQDATLPAGGTDGQVLTKTADGEEWQDVPEPDIATASRSGLMSSADKAKLDGLRQVTFASDEDFLAVFQPPEFDMSQGDGGGGGSGSVGQTFTLQSGDEAVLFDQLALVLRFPTQESLDRYFAGDESVPVRVSSDVSARFYVTNNSSSFSNGSVNISFNLKCAYQSGIINSGAMLAYIPDQKFWPSSTIEVSSSFTGPNNMVKLNSSGEFHYEGIGATVTYDSPVVITCSYDIGGESSVPGGGEVVTFGCLMYVLDKLGLTSASRSIDSLSARAASLSVEQDYLNLTKANDKEE